jgi:outer membrane immunogenic protein
MTYRNILLSVSLLTLAPFAATAGNLIQPVIAPAPAPVMAAPAPQSGNWDGFYLGGQVGTGKATDDTGDDLSGDFNTYGIHAGYMYDMGTFVLGGELAYSVLDADGDDVGVDVSLANLKFRAGYDAGNFLPYVTAGVAGLYVEDDLGDSGSDTGVVYGLGVAYAVTDNFILGGEYVRNTFEEDDVKLHFDEFSLRASYKF